MDNRERILAVTLDLFSEKGYDAVGVQEIVSKAGVSKPTLYYYFGSKRGLLDSLLKYGFDKLMDSLNPAIEEGKRDIQNSLYLVARAFLDYASENSKFFFFMLSLMYSARGGEPYQAVKPYLHALYMNIIALFDEAAHQLGNMNGRQEQFAIVFIGMLNQAAFSFSEKNDMDSGDHRLTDKQIHGLVNQFMYGIFS